ncbi:MAG: hypothetical protein KGI08_00265 [Thaumarchaeota archaeon]|nr:hypothetical protein [Nitrososphaerota archaeon]
MKHYFVCIIHNKVKVGNQWYKFQEKVARLILRRSVRALKKDINALTPAVYKVPCDEC